MCIFFDFKNKNMYTNIKYYDNIRLSNRRGDHYVSGGCH